MKKYNPNMKYICKTDNYEYLFNNFKDCMTKATALSKLKIPYKVFCGTNL